MTAISSLQNPRVKHTVRLRDRRHREKQGQILIDGLRELSRAIRGGVRLTEVFVCLRLCKSGDVQRLLEALPSTGAEILEVSEPVFHKLAFGQRAEGVLGVAEMPLWRLDDLTPRLPEKPLLAVLEGVEKPGNVGAVLRSADAAGVSALVLAEARTDLYNPNAIRASLGAIFTVPVCSATTQETLDWLRARHVAIYAARVGASLPYTKADFRGPTALALGSETAGLSAAWSAKDIRAVHLPMRGVADSLNVSVTAAVLFYEALRQRS